MSSGAGCGSGATAGVVKTFSVMHTLLVTGVWSMISTFCGVWGRGNSESKAGA